MSDSARQLLEGIARALAEDISPHVADRFAQMQCKAAAELLGNLAAELDWAPPPIKARNDELRSMLDALEENGWPAGPRPDAAAPPDRVQRLLLDQLAAAVRWLGAQPAPVREQIDAMLRDALDRQVAALRRGMFR